MSLWWAALLASVVPAQTQPATAPSAITPGIRAADAAAQALIEQVMNVPLSGGRTVSSHFSRTVEGQRALREAVLAEQQQSRPRRLADGTIEIDAWLPADRVGEMVRRAAAEHLPPSDQTKLTVDDAAGTVVVATGRYVDDGRPRGDGSGWRHCDAHQMRLVRRAVRIDLLLSVRARIGGLPIALRRTVGDLMISYPAFHEAVDRRLAALVEVEPAFEPTGLCRASMELTRAEILGLLVQAANESGDSIDVDFSRITDPAFEDPVVLIGLAVAPPTSPTRRIAAWGADASRPAWAERFLTAQATGRAPADAGDEQTRRTLAVQAARIEAIRRLWIHIEALELPDGDTIRTRTEREPAALEHLAMLERAILPVSGPTFDQNTASVTVGIRLDTVWRVMSAAQ
jgi:hypothetical protein